MWFGPENVTKEVLLLFISIPQVLKWFCSYKKIGSAGVCVCVMGKGEESNDVSCIVPCGAISSYIKLQSAGYLLVITCYIGTAKAINNWIHVCITCIYVCPQKKLSEGSNMWECIYRQKGYQRKNQFLIFK